MTRLITWCIWFSDQPCAHSPCSLIPAAAAYTSISMNYALHTFRRTPSHPLCAWLCFGFSSVWSGPLNLGLVLSAFTICRLLCCTGNISIFTWTTRNLWIGACNSTVKRTSHTKTEGLRFVWGGSVRGFSVSVSVSVSLLLFRSAGSGQCAFNFQPFARTKFPCYLCA